MAASCTAGGMRQADMSAMAGSKPGSSGHVTLGRQANGYSSCLHSTRTQGPGYGGRRARHPCGCPQLYATYKLDH